MNISRLIIALLVFVLISGHIKGQSSDYSRREIIVNTPDSLIKASIWNNSDKHKINEGCLYYWYFAGNINHNLGGFSGKLLHGKYEVFDNLQKLKVQGVFEYGLMKGTWYRWYPNGNIQFSGFYRNGSLKGKARTYTDEGKLASVLKYRNGQLNGKSYFFLKDTAIAKVYRDGKEVIKKNKSSKQVAEQHVSSDKKGDSKQIVNPASQQGHLKSEVTPKKKWWKFSFLKKKGGTNQEKKTKSLSVDKKEIIKTTSQQGQLKSEKTVKKKWWHFSFLKKKSDNNKAKKPTESK